MVTSVPVGLTTSRLAMAERGTGALAGTQNGFVESDSHLPPM